MRIREIEIPNFDYPDLYRIGMVKAQMPEQMASDGTYRIDPSERQRNIQITDRVFGAFSGPVFSQGRSPNFFLFPELSVSEEAVAQISSRFNRDDIRPNTIAVLGLERIGVERFLQLIAGTPCEADFPRAQFGGAFRFVNTAVILVKDKDSDVHTYYQPKRSRSGYEGDDQFISDLVYIFKIGYYRCVVSICSDLFVQVGGTEVLRDILSSFDRFFTQKGDNPRDVKIDLWLHLQKNPHPMGDLYTESIRTLFYRSGHNVDTSKTVVCSVNSALGNRQKEFRYSNIAVMDRGRKPTELAGRLSQKFYAWKAFTRRSIDGVGTIHYVLWRLDSPGVASYVLNMDDRPSQVNDQNRTPIEEPQVYRIRGIDLEDANDIPEVYELKEILLREFRQFIDRTFRSPELKAILVDLSVNQTLLDSLIIIRPTELLARLMSLQEHGKCILNCDLWDNNEELFDHFLLSLRLLRERFDPLVVEGHQLKHNTLSIELLDCDNMVCDDVLKKQGSLAAYLVNTDLVILQRLKDSNIWSGAKKELVMLLDDFKQTRAHGIAGDSNLITRAKFPSACSLSYLVNSLNDRNDFTNDTMTKLRETINGCL